MENKFTTDIFKEVDVTKISEGFKDSWFKEPPILPKRNMDPMAMGLSLLSNPKKLKTILVIVTTSSIIGITTVGYWTVVGLIALLEYIL